VTAWETEPKFWKVVEKSFHENLTDAPQEMLGTFKLTLYDGWGYAMEEWEISDAYIANLHFMELDHTSSSELEVEMTIQYKNVKYKSLSADGKYLPFSGTPNMGIGSLGCSKVKCPKCEHEFPYRNPDIIF